MTAFGLLFLPFCLYFWRTPARLLELVILGSVFAAAAAIVLGSFGVMPSLVPAALFVLFFGFKTIIGERYPAERLALVVLGPFIVVILGALASSIIMPRLFEGDALVWPQKLAGLLVLTPLAPNSGNYTQDMYLIANASLAVTAAVYLTRPGFDHRRLLDTYFVSGLAAVFVAIWQLAGAVAHVPFPTTFFLSNPGWSLLSEQTMGSLPRLNGTFSEPSSLAGYLCGSVSAAAWVIFNGDKSLLPKLVLYLGLAVIMLCTSATGYATLAIMLGLLLVRTVLGGTAAIRKRVATGVALGALVIGVAMAVVPAVSPGTAKEVGVIIDSTVNKKQSDSYAARSTSDADSMRAMEATYGLGVGWGSNRSSSLIPGLLAAIGVWGVAGLLVFAGGLLWHVRIAFSLTRDPRPRLVMHGCSAAILGTLTATLLSGPSISSTDFYLLMALLIATAARIRHDARAPARRVQPLRQVVMRSGVGYPGSGRPSAVRATENEAMEGGPPWTAST